MDRLRAAYGQAWKKCRSCDLGSDKTVDFGIKFEFQGEKEEEEKKEKGEKERETPSKRERETSSKIS